MNKLDKVMFTELAPVGLNGFRWICDSKDETIHTIGIGRSKVAAYRDYEIQLGSV